MPRAYMMSWDGAPNYRWRKMYKGVTYKVTCEELGAMVWTQEGSGKLADAWWRRQLETLTGPTPLERALGAVGALGESDVARLKADIERGQVARAVLSAMPVADPRQAAQEITGVEADDQRQVEMLGKMAARLGGTPVPADKTLRLQAERFLSLVIGKQKPRTFLEIRQFIESLYAGGHGLSAGMDVSALNEDKVEDVYRWLRGLPLTAPTKKKRWGFLCRFVTYLASKRLMPLPMNLKALSFKTVSRAVKTYDLAEVRAVLNGLKPRLKLYALLGLNCGMTSVDIGALTKDMVVGDKLTRRRVKTEDTVGVPTVTYALWSETMALLEQCRSSHPTLLLTSSDGTCLYETRLEGTSVKRKDLIVLQWRRAELPLTLKAFRSIAATAMEGHPVYGRCTELFLGHAPHSIKDRHYAAAPGGLLTEALAWLRGELLGAWQ